MTTSDSIPQYVPEEDVEKLAEFRLTETKSIRRLLTEVVNADALVSLYSDEDPNVFIVSRMVSINETELELEIRTEPARREDVLRHGHCTVVGFMDHVKVQFDATFIDADPNISIVRCAIPELIFRIQRRSAYRVRPPIGQPGHVVVRDAPGEEDVYEIMDISATGLSFRRLANDREFQVGDLLEHSRMELGPRVPVPCTLHVRAIIQLQRVTGMPAAWRVGCEFVNMPAEIERTVQVNVQDVERAIRRTRRT